MTDVLSLIVSLITIATVVIEGFKHAKTFYQASEELGTLQASNTLGTLILSSFFDIAPSLVR